MQKHRWKWKIAAQLLTLNSLYIMAGTDIRVYSLKKNVLVSLGYFFLLFEAITFWQRATKKAIFFVLLTKKYGLIRRNRSRLSVICGCSIKK